MQVGTAAYHSQWILVLSASHVTSSLLAAECRMIRYQRGGSDQSRPLWYGHAWWEGDKDDGLDQGFLEELI